MLCFESFETTRAMRERRLGLARNGCLSILDATTVRSISLPTTYSVESCKTSTTTKLSTHGSLHLLCAIAAERAEDNPLCGIIRCL